MDKTKNNKTAEMNYDAISALTASIGDLYTRASRAKGGEEKNLRKMLEETQKLLEQKLYQKSLQGQLGKKELPSSLLHEANETDKNPSKLYCRTGGMYEPQDPKTEGRTKELIEEFATKKHSAIAASITKFTVINGQTLNTDNAKPQSSGTQNECGATTM